jgi:adenylate cyclase
MSAEVKKEIKLEIGHVLFIDIVGYSKLLINEQSEQIQKLKQIVRGTEEVRKAGAEGKLLRLPTGDGGALVFRNSPEAPVLCAMEISRELKKHPELRVRMGIHSGPVNEVVDLNEQANIAGAGINIAQRVMDCGDAGHILLSKRAADDLDQYPQWRSLLHDLGECEVKHGAIVSVFNLYSEAFGNPGVPSRLRELRRRAAAVRQRLWTAGIAIVITLTAIGFFLYHRAKAPGRFRPALAEAKSIAVLPFDNFSDNKQETYFADGIQDDILTALSQISDLKVISRSSVMRYRDTNRDVRQIARDLDVANVLEGSVRRVGDNIRVTAQ